MSLHTTACQCEHRAHMEPDARTPNANPGHRYGQHFAFTFVVPVKTSGGTLHLCRDCREDCHHPDHAAKPAIRPLSLPWSLDDARAHHQFVISDAKGDIVALVPGTPNKAEPTHPPDDPDALRRAELIVAAVNAYRDAQ